MSNLDTAVREAAQALKDAIDAATAVGYRTVWPTSAAGLSSIAVSETGDMTFLEGRAPIPPPKAAAAHPPMTPPIALAPAGDVGEADSAGKV